MGIQRLTTRLLHKADRVSLGRLPAEPDQLPQKKIAIIDGPSFAHHIYYRYLRDSPRAEISYGTLNQALLLGLEELEQLGFQIQRIFFDGRLPASKLPTRISRLERYAAQTAAVRSRHDEQVKSRRRIPELRAFLQHARQQHQLPPPAFLVASMIEALSLSHYADLTTVVDGEAELYCAEAARDACTESVPVYIFSNDSDMLVLDSGLTTKIVILEHIEHVQATCRTAHVHALVFEPAKIAVDAGISRLSTIASFMERDSHCTFESAVAFAKKADTSERVGELLPAIQRKHSRTHGYYGDRRKLHLCDPRTAEVLYQTLDESTDTIEIFLPFVIDDPSRASSWQCGTTFRQLGLAFLLHNLSRQVTVHEYDRKGVKFLPKTLILTEDIHNDLESLNEWLREQITALESCNALYKWQVIAMLALLSDLNNQDKRLPPLQYIKQVLKGEQPRTWSQLHLRAQLHTTIYSIMQLKTFLSFHNVQRSNNSERSQEVPIAVHQTLQLLQDLPSVPELFESRKQGTSAAAFAMIEELHSSISGHAKSNQASIVEPGTDVANPDSPDEWPHRTSNNPYSLLGE